MIDTVMRNFLIQLIKNENETKFFKSPIVRIVTAIACLACAKYIAKMNHQSLKG